MVLAQLHITDQHGVMRISPGWSRHTYTHTHKQQIPRAPKRPHHNITWVKTLFVSLCLLYVSTREPEEQATGVARKGGVTHPNCFSSKTNNFYSVAYNSITGRLHDATTNHSTRGKIPPNPTLTLRVSSKR
jgi:hypothetical protein